MATKTRRQQILEAITALLETITEDNDFDYDVAVRRGLGRLDDNDMQALPLVSILESPRPEEIESSKFGATRKTDWVLYLTGYVDWQAEHPTDPAHTLLGDVKRVIATIRNESSPNFRLGGALGVDTILVGGGICRPPDDQHPASYFLLPLTITFIENTEAP